MKILPTNQQVLTWLCICPVEKNALKRGRINHKLFSVSIFLVQGIIIIGSIMFILQTPSNVEASLMAFLQLVGSFGLTYMLATAFVLRHKIQHIFGSLAQLYEKCEADDCIRFMVRVNNMGEWMWQMYMRLVLGGMFIITLIATLCSILFTWYITGQLKYNACFLYRPFKMTLPWNQETMLAYFFDVILNISTTQIYLISNGSLLLLFVSLCLFHVSFYQQFRHYSNQIDRMKLNRSKKKLIGDLLAYHYLIKAIFLESAEVYRPFILVQLMCSNILLGCTLFQLDLQLEDPGYDIAVLVFIAIAGLMNVFVYCYFGKCATESFRKMVDCIYESKWHELPIKLQKSLMLMIQNSQKPLYYHGFGFFVLNLENFTDLIKKVFAYYMMCKTITSN